jgi:hypothetical protein
MTASVIKNLPEIWIKQSITITERLQEPLRKYDYFC